MRTRGSGRLTPTDCVHSVKDKREALKARLEEARRSGGVGVDKIRKELANLAKRTGTASALSLVLTVVVAYEPRGVRVCAPGD